MSSQRIIQDSDDEDVDARSEVASSCDPLQDTSSYAPGRTEAETARADVNQAADFQIPLSATDLLPQVDFDRFLRSESSIMAGDYEDERWVSTANSGSAHVAHVGNDHTEQLRDDSFLYTINATTAHCTLPQPLDVVVYGEDFDNHPSKRRRVSPLLEPSHNNKELGKSTETNSSYNYFASSGPNDDTSFREVATPLLPRTTDESHGGATTVLNSIPVPIGTPPPTIPFSEDAPYEQEQTTTAAPIPQYEIQETGPDPDADPRQLLSETDTEAALGTSTTTKKKRGRPKKQSANPENKTAADDTSEEVSEHHQQTAIKKKPGRPKKQEKNDTPSEQLPALDNISNGGVPDASIELSTPLNASVSKPSKKKIKRSKTTSDIPNKKPDELQTESDVIWVESRPVVEEDAHEENHHQPLPRATTEEEKKKKKTTTTTDPHDTTKEGQLTDEKTSSKAPKKRGRKRKETLEGPAAPFTENQAAVILQDISNVPPPLPPPPQQNKEKNIEIDAKSDDPNSGGLDGSTKNTPKSPSEDASINKGNVVGQGTGVETPTTVANTMQPVKQTPISNTGKVPFRVGLSRRARIAPLLKVVKK